MGIPGRNEIVHLLARSKNSSCDQPDASIACLDTVINDRQLISSLGTDALMGLGAVLIFSLLQTKIVLYRIRTMLPQVTVKPPRIGARGLKSILKWLYVVIVTSDQDLLATSGMDALMLVKTMSFGIQLFLPITVFSACILIPMHKSGGREKSLDHKFEVMTITNIEDGSKLLWIHFFCVYAIIGYALFLLFYHQKRYVELRHHYLTAGDDPNLWRVRYQSSEEQPKPRHIPSLAETASQISQFLKQATGLGDVVSKDFERPKGLLSRAAKSDKDIAQKLRDDLNADGAFVEADTELDDQKVGKVNSVTGKKSLQSIFSMPVYSRPPGEEQGGENGRSNGFDLGEIAEGTTEDQNIVPKSEIQDDVGDGFNVNIISEETPCQESTQNEVGKPAVLKWWDVDCGESEGEDSLPLHYLQRGVHTARPSVRFLKTVNTQDLQTGETVAMNAQQYCVLITDVPRLDMVLKSDEKNVEKRKRQKPERIPKILSHIWSWLFSGIHARDVNPRNLAGVVRSSSRAIHPDVLEKYGTVVMRASSKDENDEDDPNRLKNPLMGTSKGWGKVAEKVRTQEIFQLDECVVASSFKSLFPNDFVRALPIRVHKEIDLLLSKWDKLAGQLEEQEYLLSKAGKRPQYYVERRWWSWMVCRMCGRGVAVDAIDHLKSQILNIERTILETRKKIMADNPSSTWLLIFRTQFAATIAAQTLLHTESGHKFRAHPAPGPDEMNWQALWKTWLQKDVRTVLVFPLLALVIMFPLGVFAGALSKLAILLCDEERNVYLGEMACKDDGGLLSVRRIVTAWVPPILVAIWQNSVMPNMLYTLVQMQARCISLSRLDRSIAGLFFLWDVFNIFVGGMLGGTVLSRLTDIVEGNAGIIKTIGEAVPASSNFFINYVVLRAFFLLPLQLILPHPGVWNYIFRLGGLVRTHTARAKTMLWKSRSIRYGREYGILMLIFVIALVYAVIAPVIVPLALLYFIISWIVWRYLALYVFVRKYEGGGQMWSFVFHRMLFILWFFQLFTSCLLTVKRAYWQAASLWVTVPIILIQYWRYCDDRFKSGMEYVPLEMANMAPEAEVDPKVYTPPALIQGCAGWHPEYMTAWEGWRAPQYCL